MTLRPAAPGIALLLGLGLLSPSIALADPPAPAALEAPEVAARVVDLFRQGQLAYARNDNEAAYRAYLAAWALRKSHDIATNLGNVELDLRRYRDAARHLAFGLRELPPTIRPETRQEIRDRLGQAIPHVGRVRVHLNVAGAAVTVNGELVAADGRGADLFVEPGPCTVEASRAGYAAARAVVQAPRGGEPVDATLTLVELPASPPALAPDGLSGGSGGRGGRGGRGGPSTALLITGAGLTAGALAAGVGFSVAANGQANKASAELAAVKQTGRFCPGGSIASTCSDLRATLTSQSDLHDLALGAFVSAGVLGAATLVYAAVSGTGGAAPDAPGAAVRVAPLAGASLGGVLVSGSF